MTLEALMINELKPTLNTKDEYRRERSHKDIITPMHGNYIL